MTIVDASVERTMLGRDGETARSLTCPRARQYIKLTPHVCQRWIFDVPAVAPAPPPAAGVEFG